MFKSKWLNVNGLKIHYLEEGKGKPLILLHGGGRKISGEKEWKPNINHFSKYYRVIVPDLPGFGLSDKPRVNYSFEYLSSHFFEFMEFLNFKKVILMGHSLGGSIAVYYSVKKPEKVEKLVLVNTAGFGKEISLPGRVLLEIFSLLARLEKDHVFPSIMRHGEVNLIKYLPGLKVPTLIVWGNHDPYLPLKHASRAKKLLKNSRLKVFKGCSHAPQIEKPLEFNKTVLKFLLNGK